jgi:hypothetical protein
VLASRHDIPIMPLFCAKNTYNFVFVLLVNRLVTVWSATHPWLQTAVDFSRLCNCKAIRPRCMYEYPAETSTRKERREERTNAIMTQHYILSGGDKNILL